MNIKSPYQKIISIHLIAWLYATVAINAQVTTPLHNKILDFKYEQAAGVPAANEVAWDDAFINPMFWNKLPVGAWRIESKTELAVKYVSEEKRDFIGGPARLVRVRTDGKGNTQSIEVMWCDYSYSFEFFRYPSLDGLTAKQRRAQLEIYEETKKKWEEDVKVFETAIQESEKYLTQTLEKRFGKPEKNKIGKDKDFVLDVLDYATPHGTTIRLYPTKDRMIIATIHKTTELEARKQLILTNADEAKSRGDEAIKNVVKLPNGDVTLKNIPMHEQGPRGACVWASGAMVLEYWGSPIPVELLLLRNGDFNGTTKAGAQMVGAMKDSKLKMSEASTRMASIMAEIDKGRPLQVSRTIREDRNILHREWRDKAAADPNFEIPKESRKDQKEKWPGERDMGHASLITGYNKEKKVILLTESWGEGNRNNRISWEEFEATCREIQTFTP
jgi:hypothetical protein